VNRIEILTKQAKNYADDFLLEQIDFATEADEVRVLELELESRTSPYLAADSSRSLLGDLLGGASLFGGAR
jgi:hypothetical protein